MNFARKYVFINIEKNLEKKQMRGDNNYYRTLKFTYFIAFDEFQNWLSLSREFKNLLRIIFELVNKRTH